MEQLTVDTEGKNGPPIPSVLVTRSFILCPRFRPILAHADRFKQAKRWKIDIRRNPSSLIAHLLEFDG
jgi:hypothetical protein